MSQLSWNLGAQSSGSGPAYVEIDLPAHLVHGSRSAYIHGKCRCVKCRLWAASQHQANRERFNTYKARPCMDCGGSFPPEAMEFDHRPGEPKHFQPAHMKGWRADRIERELAKCDLVCANCHAIRTRQRLIAAQVERFGRPA
jgi:hypothetical protein